MSAVWEAFVMGRRLPEPLMTIFKENILDENKVDEKIVEYILDAHDYGRHSAEILTDFRMIKAMFRLYKADKISVIGNVVASTSRVKIKAEMKKDEQSAANTP